MKKILFLTLLLSACHSRLIPGSQHRDPEHSDVLSMSGTVQDSHQTWRIDELMKPANGVLVCEINGVRLNQYEFKYIENGAYKSVALRDRVFIEANGLLTIPQPRIPAANVGDTWKTYFEVRS